MSNSLDSFELYYEEMEKKKVTKKYVNKSVVRPQVSTKQKIKAKLAPINARFFSVVNKVKHPSKKHKKLTKDEKKLAKQQRNRGIMGIGLLLVVVSIAYSTSVIFIGVDSPASKLVLLPQALFALVTLFKAFSKLYK